MFDYRHTCPKIDREIDSAKAIIENNIENLIEELSPYACFKSEIIKHFIKDKTESIYKDLESCFESCRASNQEMRQEAENQMNALHLEIEELKEINKELR